MSDKSMDTYEELIVAVETQEYGEEATMFLYDVQLYIEEQDDTLHKLHKALWDAICSPMGVVPDSALPFYENANEEAKRT